MADDKIQVILDVVNDMFKKDMKESSKATKAFGETTDKVTKEATKDFDKVAKSVKNVSSTWSTFKGVFGAQAVIAGLGRLTTAVTNFTNESVELAKVQEEAVNKLATAMETAGDFSEEALEQHKAFASQLQENSKIGDETTLTMLALAKSYGATNEEAQKVVKAAADMSIATGQSLDSAVRNLSGTLNGQIGLLGKLDDGLKSLTKEQLANGDAIELMAKKFEGAAKGELNTFDGALQQAKNSFGDLQEEVGFLITQNDLMTDVLVVAKNLFISMGTAVQGAGELYNETTKFIEENEKILTVLVGGLSAGAIAWAGYTLALNAAAIATTVVTVATSAFGVALAVITSPITLIAAGIVALGAAITATVVYWDEITAAIGRATDFMIRFINKTSALGKFALKIFGVEIPEAHEASTESLEENLSEQEDRMRQNAAEESKLAEKKKKELAKREAELKKKKEQEKKLTVAEKKALAAAEAKELERKKAEQDEFFAWERSTIERQEEFRQMTLKQRVDNTQKGLKSMTGLMQAENKEAFRIGQAAAIANATIDTYRAANAAYAAMAGIPIVGPGLGIAAAAGAITAGLAQVKAIQSQSFQMGGIVGGTSFTGDNVPVNVNSGEMILNREQQTELFDIANGTNNNNLDEKIEALLMQPVIVQIDGVTVAQAVRNQEEAGFGGS